MSVWKIFNPTPKKNSKNKTDVIKPIDNDLNRPKASVHSLTVETSLNIY